MDHLTHNESDDWTLVIKSKNSWFNLHLYEIWRYRDLLWMFIKRDFVTLYKQTILGPLWYIIQPVLTTFIFVVIFNRIAGIPTDGIPATLFYLSGLVIWNYFSSCLNTTANTFVTNAGIFGKVYFPRLIVPLANVLAALISFGIQLFILVVIIGYYYFVLKVNIHFSFYIFIIPFLLLIIAGLGLGLGIIISSLTTKYRDLVFLVTFGVQLLMYATPIIYPLSFVNESYRAFILLNPLTAVVEVFRYALLGVGDFSLWPIVYSVFFTATTLFIGVLVFNKVEKSFMDVI